MKQVCRLVLGVIMGSCLAAGQSAVPQAPSEDFRDVEAAIYATPSWHAMGTRPVVVNGLRTGTTPIEMETTCPDRELVVMGEAGAQVRFVVLGEEAWTSTNGFAESSWQKLPKEVRLPCAHDELGGRQMRPETASPAGILVVRGTLCRQWRLSFYDENDAEIEGILCAGFDNLPLEISYSDGLRLTFIDWGHTDVVLPVALGRIRDLMVRGAAPPRDAK